MEKKHQSHWCTTNGARRLPTLNLGLGEPAPDRGKKRIQDCSRGQTALLARYFTVLFRHGARFNITVWTGVSMSCNKFHCGSRPFLRADEILPEYQPGGSEKSEKGQKHDGRPDNRQTPYEPGKRISYH